LSLFKLTFWILAGWQAWSLVKETWRDHSDNPGRNLVPTIASCYLAIWIIMVLSPIRLTPFSDGKHIEFWSIGVLAGFGKPSRGEVVGIKLRNRQVLSERVLAFPGDRLQVAAGQVVTNGTPLGLYSRQMPRFSQDCSGRVPEGRLAIIPWYGVNKLDCRDILLVPSYALRDRCLWIFWPPGDYKLCRPPTSR